MNKLLLLLALAIPAFGQSIVYQEGFESGVQPPNWYPWNSGAFPDSWDHTPALSGQFSTLFTSSDPLATPGAYYYFANPLDQVQVDFIFQVSQPATPFYESLFILMDAGFNYPLSLQLQVDELWVYTDEGYYVGQLPLNTTVALRVTYADSTNTNVPSQLTVSWSVYPEVPPYSGPQFVSDISGYHTPMDRLLFGPVGYGTYIVDNLILTSPIPPVVVPPPPPPGHGHHHK